MVLSDRIRGNKPLQMEDSHFEQKKTFMTEHWNGLSKEVVEAPSLETRKADWMLLSNLL